METGPGRFPGRGSPGSWEVGRYGYLPYVGINSMETGPTQISRAWEPGQIQLAGKDTCPTEAFVVWKPVLRGG